MATLPRAAWVTVAVWYALRCLGCPVDGVEDITQCDTIAKCDDNQECYTEVQTQGDRVRYYAGCGFQGKCIGARLNPIGRRDDNHLCRQCCQDQDFCNSHLCEVNTNIGDNYTLCLSGITSSPEIIDKIKYCNPSEECFSQVYFNGGSLEYHLGCDRSLICGDANPGKRDFVLCGNCCRGNFCNLNLCRRDRGTTTIPTTKQHTTVTFKQQPTTSPAPTAASTHHGPHTQHTNHPHNDNGGHSTHSTRHPPNTGGHGHASPSPDSVTPVQQTNPSHQTLSSATVVPSSSPGSLRCVQCPSGGVEDITQCNTIAVCADHEQCYIEVQIQGATVKYHAGCGIKEKCPHPLLANPIGRRDDYLVCRQCCDKENLCNIKLCDIHTNVKAHYPLCLSGVTSSPDISDRIEYCGPSQECFSQVGFQGGSAAYHLGCQRKMLCGDVKPGKRETMPCNACCSGNFCNRDLCRTNKSATAMAFARRERSAVTTQQQPTNTQATAASPLLPGSHTHLPHHGDHGEDEVHHHTISPQNTGHEAVALKTLTRGNGQETHNT